MPFPGLGFGIYRCGFCCFLLPCTWMQCAHKGGFAVIFSLACFSLSSSLKFGTIPAALAAEQMAAETCPGMFGGSWERALHLAVSQLGNIWGEYVLGKCIAHLAVSQYNEHNMHTTHYSTLQAQRHSFWHISYG